MQHPAIPSLTSAPLRNRIRVALGAPPRDVWALIGDLPRLPEYSAGLESVDIASGPGGQPAEYVCHFKPAEPGAPAIVHRERMRWFEPGRGYASSAEAGNAFGLHDSVNLVTVEPGPDGTLLTWDEYFDAPDVAMNREAFDLALADSAERLIARFGGRVLERFAGDSDVVQTGPLAAAAAMPVALNRGELEAALALYEPAALLMVQPEQAARGREQIREALRGFIALRPTLVSLERHVLEADDVALYMGRWTLAGIGRDGALVTMDGVSSDVLRRQPDGRWLIALDNPWGTAVLKVNQVAALEVEQDAASR